MALHHVPDPRMIDWPTWVAALIADNPQAVHLTASEEARWREVGDLLVLQEPTCPRPDMFPDWRDWALALMSTSAT